MGKFTVIPQDAFAGLQLDAGVLLKRFDPDNPAAPEDADIVCATTGGINASCVPTYTDLGEDVDNVPLNMMEYKHLDSWECKVSTTSLGTTPELIKMTLGVADTDGNKIVPRADLRQSDFRDIWWVGDRADGGFVAIQIKNALSTSGFEIQTTKNGKGQITLEITGHVSIKNQKQVPMVFYSADPVEDATLSAFTLSGVTLTPEFDPAVTSYTGVASAASSEIVATKSDSDAELTLSALGTTIQSGDTVNWVSGGTNIVEAAVVNGPTSKTYTVTVDWTAPVVDTTLSTLTIGSLTLTPTFDPDTTSYTAETSNATDAITAEATDDNATVEIKNGSVVITSGGDATWTSGENTVTITVTNGTATKVYTVVVTYTGV